MCRTSKETMPSESPLLTDGEPRKSCHQPIPQNRWTRIRQYKDYIAHYHTAGVPGRNELDDQQEINYPPIMRAIVETGYQGYIGQEFIPRIAKTDDEKIASLRAAVKLCDV